MAKFIFHKGVKDFNKLLNVSLLTSILFAVIGAVLLFIPSLSAKVIGYICGGIFLINGLSIIYKYIEREGAKLYRYNLIYGIIFAILGLLIILVPYSVTSFLTVMFGLYLATIGSTKVTYAIWFKIGDDSSWLLTLIIGIMLILFGILIIVNPFSNLAMTQLIGTFILLSSILDITDIIMLKNRAEKVVKIFW